MMKPFIFLIAAILILGTAQLSAQVILGFEVQGSAGLVFWSGLIRPDTSELIGDIDRVEFGYR